MFLVNNFKNHLVGFPPALLTVIGLKSEKTELMSEV